MAKDINKQVFDEATKLKLKIFGECFEEWLPVVNHDPYTNKIFVFDLFAGSGKDANNNFGSPLVLLDKAKGRDCEYCSNAKKPVIFAFNDEKTKKSEELAQNIDQYLEQCQQKNNCSGCIYECPISSLSFKDFFTNKSIVNVFKDKSFGKFILLDQYGFSQIDEDVFNQLVSYPKTDFIFFISSSFISRFREHLNITKYFDTSKIDFDAISPNEIHRAVADYFRDLIPKHKEYY